MNFFINFNKFKKNIKLHQFVTHYDQNVLVCINHNQIKIKKIGRPIFLNKNRNQISN